MFYIFSFKLSVECGLMAHTLAIKHIATGVMYKELVAKLVKTPINMPTTDKTDKKISLGDFYRGCLSTLFIAYTMTIVCVLWELRLIINKL